MTIVLYLLILLAIIQGMVSLKDGWRNARYALNYTESRSCEASTVVFCPLKGKEPHLETNLRSLLRQDHPDYRVVFIVDSEDEPALGLLRGLGHAEVLVAGLALGCGQKVHNLVEAIRRLKSSPVIYAFADADAQFPKDWLSNLVAPLRKAQVGAATGYRWYVPADGNLPGLIRSAWNASVVGFFGPHRNNFAWGGSMAIRREVFERIGVIEAWRGAVSDDYALTAAVRAAGLEMVYVPTCLVPSHDRCSWRGLLEFTTRQIRITRVYAPRVWLLGMTTYTLFNLTFVWLTFAMWGDLTLLVAWLGIYALSAFRAEERQRGVGRQIRHASLVRHRWFYRLSAPITGLLYEFNFLVSLLSRRVLWKGVAYRLISPNETRIEHR